MMVVNVHERTLDADPERAGALIDTLASNGDRLWPKHAWPRMTFDRPLAVGAKGGHGPIRYTVEEYDPGKSIRFRFTGPRGFNGWHGYHIRPQESRPVALRHALEMNTGGMARLSWPLIYRPLHDALIEDSLATAESSLGCVPHVRPWSLWVKILRWIISRGRSRPRSKRTPIT